MVDGGTAAASRRLAGLKREADREFRSKLARQARDRRHATRGGSRRLQRAALFALTACVLGALPFAALVRGSVYLHQARGVPAWLALAAGAAATVALLGAYVAWLARRVIGHGGWHRAVWWFALPLVAFYAGFTLIYVSSANLKRPELRTHYTALHPLLRVALATLILVDKDLVLTDLARGPGDYARMGLPVQEASWHFPQRDGWVHAVDLRTSGRSAVANRLVEWYFRGMGFVTLRHVGSADHLHVALSAPD